MWGIVSIFWENGVGGNFGFGGRARKITPLIYPLIFENFFGHETGRRGSFWSFSTTDPVIFQAGAEFEVKSGVDSYIWCVF